MEAAEKLPVPYGTIRYRTIPTYRTYLPSDLRYRTVPYLSTVTYGKYQN